MLWPALSEVYGIFLKARLPRCHPTVARIDRSSKPTSSQRRYSTSFNERKESADLRSPVVRIVRSYRYGPHSNAPDLAYFFKSILYVSWRRLAGGWGLTSHMYFRRCCDARSGSSHIAICYGVLRLSNGRCIR